MAPELRKRTKSQTVVEKPAVVKKTKATPKRQAAEDASPVSAKKQKTVKVTKEVTEVKTTTPAEEPKPRAAKASKKKAAKAPEPEPETMEVDEEEVVEEADESVIPVAEASDSEDGDDDEIDADIQALAAGLDPEDDDGSTPNSAGFKAGQDVGKIPQRLSKKEKKALAAARNTVKEEPGVIYVGRLPHGFYETELKGYFGQFGAVSRLRLSRNKKTGKSKHFAFIEFAEESTAHIAAKTMDKYLLFGHILTVKFVGKDQLNANVWKGANKRFKQIPWNKIAGKKLARPLTEEAWEERNAKETKRRADRAEKLKAIGYEFEAPALKAAPAPAPVKAVEEKKPEAAVEEAPAVEAPAAEEAPVVEETVVETTVTEEVVEETPKTKKGKAGKKGKKAKA